jgi:hypothetical protein
MAQGPQWVDQPVRTACTAAPPLTVGVLAMLAAVMEASQARMSAFDLAGAPIDPAATPPAPPAPVAGQAPVARRKPNLNARGRARRAGRVVHVRLTGKLRLPPGILQVNRVQRHDQDRHRPGANADRVQTGRVSSSCAFALRLQLKRSRSSAKKLTLKFHHSGNAVLTSIKKSGSIKVK